VIVWVVFNVISAVAVSADPASVPEIVAVPVPRDAGAVNVAV